LLASPGGDRSKLKIARDTANFHQLPHLPAWSVN
jgi:hypothetical protein